MTIIVYRAGTLASDSVVTQGNSRSGRIEKIWRCKDGSLAGWAGSVQTAQAFRRFTMPGIAASITSRVFNPSSPSGEGILVTPGGQVWSFEGDGEPFQIRSKTGHVLGSGSAYAQGALAMGATATQAVEIASQLCTSCGGGTKVLALPPKSSSPSNSKMFRRSRAYA